MIDLKDIPNYDPEIVQVASLDRPPADIADIKRILYKFIQINHRFFSVEILARFLGTDIKTAYRFMGSQIAKYAGRNKPTTILIVRPQDKFTGDYSKYLAGKI